MKGSFNTSRFGKYFIYDLRQLWRNHSKGLMLIGMFGVILYFTYILTSLIFTQQWNTPGIVARTITFCAAAFIMNVYCTRLYGHLTDKKEGSTWLMIPASPLEKFISLLIVSIIVVPAIFLGTYLISDAIIALVDPSVDGTICGAVTTFISTLMENLKKGFFDEVHVAPFPIAFAFITSIFSSILYFVLCGTYFKKWKIVGAFGVILLIQIVLTNVMGAVFQYTNAIEWFKALGDSDPQRVINRLLLIGNTFNLLEVALFAGLIYLRIKTLKH